MISVPDCLFKLQVTIRLGPWISKMQTFFLHFDNDKTMYKLDTSCTVSDDIVLVGESGHGFCYRASSHLQTEVPSVEDGDTYCSFQKLIYCFYPNRTYC